MNQREREEEKFGWKDIIAFVIALLQTGLLPVVLLFIFLIIMALVLIAIRRCMLI